MSYVKTEWVDNQTPLSAENLNHIEDGIEQNSQDIDNVPVLKSVGRDSMVQKTVNLPDDVDDEGNPIDRTNVANGAFSAVFGSRNETGERASESLVTGGDNHDFGQDNLMFGYHCNSYANQNLTGGYRVHNYGAESFAMGSNVEIQGDITTDSDGNPKSNTKSVLAIGTNVYVGEGSRDSAVVGKNIYTYHLHESYSGPANLRSSHIVGENITMYDGCKWVDVKGYGHHIGENVECVYVRGYENGVSSKVTDSAVFGYANNIGNTFHNQNEKEQYVYLFGSNNTNRWNDEADTNSKVCMFGEGLRSTKDGQFIVGKYNSGVPNAIFEIGDGESDNDRRSPFAVINGYSFISGSTVVNDYVETSCVVGWQNTINSETYGSAVFGNYNILGAVAEVDYSFIAGDNNTVTHNHSSAIGHYLVSTAADQTTVGKFNSTASAYNSAYFQVGTGTSASNRRTSFAVFSDKVMMPTTTSVGEYGATTQYVQNIVGDINSVLDAINGQVI